MMAPVSFDTTPLLSASTVEPIDIEECGELPRNVREYSVRPEVSLMIYGE